MRRLVCHTPFFLTAGLLIVCLGTAPVPLRANIHLVDTYIERTFIYPLQVDPDNDSLRTQLLKMYLNLNRIDTAIATGSDYLLDERGNKGATCNSLGNAYFFMGDLRQAALYYRQAAALLPDDDGIRSNLSRALEALGKPVPPRAKAALESETAGRARSAAATLDANSFYWVE